MARQKKDVETPERAGVRVGEPHPAAPPANPQSEAPAEGPAETQTDGQPAEEEPAADGEDEPAARPSGAASTANEAAPLSPPQTAPRGVGQALQATPPAIGAVMHERHLGICDGAGNPVDLEKVILKEVPAGNVRRATQRIFEETTMPGTERTRRRLLYGQDAVVPDAEYQALCAAVAERQSADPS